MYMLLFFSNVSCGQNRTVISDKEQENVVLYDVQGLKYEQLWRLNNITKVSHPNKQIEK